MKKAKATPLNKNRKKLKQDSGDLKETKSHHEKKKRKSESIVESPPKVKKMKASTFEKPSKSKLKSKMISKNLAHSEISPNTSPSKTVEKAKKKKIKNSLSEKSPQNKINKVGDKKLTKIKAKDSKESATQATDSNSEKKTSDESKLTRKQMRNKKKSNSKKNKYKHLDETRNPDGKKKCEDKSEATKNTPNRSTEDKPTPELDESQPRQNKNKKRKRVDESTSNETNDIAKLEAPKKKKRKTLKEDKGSPMQDKNILDDQKETGLKLKKKKKKVKTVLGSKISKTKAIKSKKKASNSDEDDSMSDSASIDADFNQDSDMDSDDGGDIMAGLPAATDCLPSSDSKRNADTPPEAKPTKKKKVLSAVEQAKEKLNAARFRYLNEQLYTSTGEAAMSMFKEDPDAFDVYHQGFRSQVAQWPLNPLDTIITQLGKLDPKTVIADFGCGDGRLSESLPSHKVHSFDLVASKPFITACDIAKVPLKASSVDVAVFCLSLMGTNLSDYLCEANRVLKHGGSLKIAEVVSRCYSVSHFTRKVEALGFTCKKKEFLGKMFLFFTFSKVKDASRKKALKIELKPCLYKKR